MNNNEGTITQGEPPKKKLGGVFFWMTGGLALLKDIVLDPLCDLGYGSGGALMASVLGAPLGITLIASTFFVKIIFSSLVWFIMQFYFVSHGGLHSSAKMKRLVAWLLAFVVGIIPVADILPETTILFFFVAYLENSIRNGGLASYALQTKTAQQFLEKSSFVR